MGEKDKIILKKFVIFACRKLKIKAIPPIRFTFVRPEEATQAVYHIGNDIIICIKDRQIADICRSVAHELVHHWQHEHGDVEKIDNPKQIGGKLEDEANALAGQLVKEFGTKICPMIYEIHCIMEKENIKGGKAKGLTSADLARKHHQFIGTIEKEIELGIKVEMEHTPDKNVAREIAMDHITEFHDYYSNPKYGLKSTEKKMEKETEKKSKKTEPSKKEINHIITNFLKKYKNKEVPDELVHELADEFGIETDKLESAIYSFAEKYVNANESDLTRLGAIIKENMDLSITDEAPTSLTYNIVSNDVVAGQITVNTFHPDFGKDTLEIIGFKLDPRYKTIKTAFDAVHSLWSAHKNANKIVVSPADESIEFWTKLGFTHLNNDYHILARGH